jgi:hypothetical protein
MATSVFIASVMFAILVAYYKKIDFLSPFGIFIAFQILYNAIPDLMNYMGMAFFPLIGNKSVIDVQMMLAASANICFCLVFALFYKKVSFMPTEGARPNRHRKNYLLLAFPVFVLTLYLSYKFGWNARQVAEASGGGLYTIASYVKEWFVGIYLYYIYRYGLDKGAFALIFAQAIIVMIDGARTTFLPIVLMTLILYNLTQRGGEKKYKMYALAFLTIVLSIVARALIVSGNSALLRMSIPITVEGTMGAYPSLQAVYIVTNQFFPHLTYGLTYVLDPFIWLSSQSIIDKYSFWTSWTVGNSTLLQNTFAPMGGFYYMAEAVAAFYYAGPAIVTTLYALSLVFVERNINKYRILYLTWMPTIGLLFVKLVFGNAFKLFLVLYLVVYAYVFCGRIRAMYLRQLHNKAAATARDCNLDYVDREDLKPNFLID